MAVSVAVGIDIDISMTSSVATTHVLQLLLALAPASASATLPTGTGTGVDPVPPALTEPFPPLHGNDPAGGRVSETSPDPLVATTWSSGTNITNQQYYTVAVASAWVATPESAFTGLDTLGTPNPKVTRTMTN